MKPAARLARAEVDGQHAAARAELALRHVRLGMAGQARPGHRADGRVGLQVGASVAADWLWRSMRTCSVCMPRSTRKALKGATMPPVSMLTRRTASMRSRAPGHDAGDDIGVAAQPLRGGLDDEVRAQRQRLAEVRRGEGVVDGDDGAVGMAQLGQAGKVGDHDGRVGDGLGVEQARGRRRQRGLDGVEVGGVDVDAPPPRDGRRRCPGARACCRRRPAWRRCGRRR